MNVLFLSLYSINSLEDGYIYADIAKEFYLQGHNVFVLTPNNLGGKTHLVSIDDSCKILKLSTGSVQKVGKIKKLYNLFMLEKRAIKSLKKHASDIKFDLVITMVSNLSLLETTNYIKKRDSAKVYNLLKDIFPQNAADMGMIKNDGFIYRHFRKKEKKYYRLSSYIGVYHPLVLNILWRKILSLQTNLNTTPTRAFLEI